MFLLKQILPAAIMAMMVAAGVCGFALFWGKERVARRARSSRHWSRLFVWAFRDHGLGAVSARGHDQLVALFCAGGRGGRRILFSRFSLSGGAKSLDGALTLPTWPRVLIFCRGFRGSIDLAAQAEICHTAGRSPTAVSGWGVWQARSCYWPLYLDALVRRSPTAIEMPAFLLIICAGTFGALMLSGSILLGQFALGAGRGCAWQSGSYRSEGALGRGIVPVFSLLLGTLLLSGYFFAELPATSAALLAFAPVLALIPIRMLSASRISEFEPLWCPFPFWSHWSWRFVLLRL